MWVLGFVRDGGGVQCASMFAFLLCCLPPSMALSTENTIFPKATKSRNPISQYLTVQVQIHIFVELESVPTNLSFWIW